MKKVVRVAFALGAFALLLPGLAAAQDRYRSYDRAPQRQSWFSIGPKIGVNYATLRGDDNRFNPTAFTSVMGGAFIRLSGRKWYLQPEGYFSGSGSNLSVTPDPNSPSGSANGRVRLTTFDTPLLLGYKIVTGKVFNLRLMAGPVASFVIKENQNDLNLLSPGSYTYNRSNIGFQAGAGFDIGNLTFDARYEAGLNRINPLFNQRSALYQFSVGFKIF